MSFLKQIDEFRRHMDSVRRSVTLPPGREWYPYNSLAGLQHLTLLRLGEMIGSGPVLDIGSGDGDIAFFLESLGYLVDTVDKPSSNHNDMTAVYALRERLGSSVAIHAVDLDARPHLPRSGYGLAIMLGVLYHLKNPFLVLEELARHARHIYLSTRIASFSGDRKVNFGSQPMAYLVGDQELNYDRTNFWIFSPEGLRRILDRSGWTVREFITSGPSDGGDPVTDRGDARAYVLAESRVAAHSNALQLTYGWNAPEEGGWRWTERRFAAEAAIVSGSNLRFRFHVPPQRPAFQLRARINGAELAAMRFSTPGEHEYTSPMPQTNEVATVEFELDTAFHPGGADVRDLGVLVDFSGAPPITIY